MWPQTIVSQVSYLLLPHVCPTRLKQKTQGRSQAAGPAPQHHPGLASLHLVGAAAARSPGRLPGCAAPTSSPRRPGPRADSLPCHEEVSGGTRSEWELVAASRSLGSRARGPSLFGRQGQAEGVCLPWSAVSLWAAFQENRRACSVRSYSPPSALGTLVAPSVLTFLLPFFFKT